MVVTKEYKLNSCKTLGKLKYKKSLEMRNQFYTNFKNKNNILAILTSQSNLKLNHNKDAPSWTSLYNS